MITYSIKIKKIEEVKPQLKTYVLFKKQNKFSL